MTEQTLAQEIALVTGASRGIGRAIAIELARRGATVVGTATSEAGAQGITQQLAEAGKVRGIVLNVADPQSIEAALKDIEAHEGAPTVLVNNAGITRDNLLLRMKEEEWNDIVATNLGSVFRLSKGVRARHDEGAPRPDHQHRVGRRRDGQRRADQLRGGEGRHHRFHASRWRAKWARAASP